MEMLKRWIIILSFSSVLVYGNPIARNNEVNENEIEDNNIADLDINSFAKCSYKDGMTGVINCAAMRALKILQQAIKRNSIEILPGIALTSETLPHDREAKAIENEILPSDPKEKTEKLFELIFKAAGRFFSGRTLKIKLPEINANGLARAFEEGDLLKKRGKMKKGGIGMSPLLLGLGAKLLLLKALAIAGLAFMSVKALVLSKIALVLAVIFGAQSLFGGAFSLKDFGSSSIGKHGWINGWTSGGGSGYGPSYGYGTPHHHGWTTNNIGGWGNSQYPYARSIDDVKEDDLVDSTVQAQDLAYSKQHS